MLACARCCVQPVINGPAKMTMETTIKCCSLRLVQRALRLGLCSWRRLTRSTIFFDTLLFYFLITPRRFAAASVPW